MRVVLCAVACAALACLAVLAQADLVPNTQSVATGWSTDSFSEFVELSHSAFAAPAKKAAPPAPKRINGKIKLNNVFYQTDCKCRDPYENSQCKRPVRMRIHKEEFNAKLGLDKNTLTDFLGLPQSLQNVRTPRVSLADLDPRHPDAVVATPGGDFGEFLTAVASWEGATGVKATTAQIRGFLAAWLADVYQPMMYLTDDAAVVHLRDNLHVNGKTRTVLKLDLANPPVALQPELLKDLKKPDNHGSFYIKALLQDPERFYMRRGLVESFIEAFFTVLWDKSTRLSDNTLLSGKIVIRTVSGEAKPRAFVSIRSSEACEEENVAVAFPTRVNKGYGEVQILINHPAAGAYTRRMLAEFFLGVDPHPDLTASEMYQAINRRANGIMENCAQILGNSLPFYTVTVE